MPLYEDFRALPTGDYVEVDEDGDITVIEHKLTISTMRRDAVSYLYRDMGAGHFGDFEHLLQFACSHCDETAYGAVYGMTSTSHTVAECGTNDEGFVVQIADPSDLPLTLFLSEFVNDTLDTCVIEYNTEYYIKVKRVGATVTVDVFDNPARTSLITGGHLEVTNDNTTHRFVHPCMSKDKANWPDRVISFTVENLTLQEGWLGKINGITNPAKINGISVTDIVKVNGVVSS